jgi:hypothetical protein
VSEFIDRTTATWNCEKLKECFLPMDVEAILNLPLSTRNQQDEWAWHYDRKGIFTVRSAYKMLVHTKTSREAWLEGSASSSDTKKVEKQWTSLWRIQVPSKIECTMAKCVWALASEEVAEQVSMTQQGNARDWIF